MSKTTLKINTTVPAPEHPGAPALVCYDNGDWEFTHVNEIEHLTGVIMADNFASILTEVAMDFGGDEMDQVDGESIFDLDITVTASGPREDVLGIFEDGEFTVMDRRVAETMIAAEQSVFNFIPLTDLVDEFHRYLKNHRGAMFAYRTEEPIDLSDWMEDD